MPRARAASERRSSGLPAALRPAGVLLPAVFGAFWPLPAVAAVGAEMQFVLSTFSFLFWGALVMWMCSGFTMLEAGSVRTRNASVICMKNVGLYSIAAVVFYLVGYNIMYTGVEPGGWFGSLDLFYGTSAAERGLLEGDESQAALVMERGHSAMSAWFFQMVFVASTGSIVSGTLAERVKVWPFFVFIAVLTAFIYPVIGAWTWGGGWLAAMGFKDFAGSTVVHSTGGWAALAGVLVVGAREGKFRADGSVKATPPNNVPAVTLGVFIIWLGFLGFNGGSQLALRGVADAIAVGNILVNTNLASAAGLLTALALSRPLFGRVDLLATLNGAIGGLVAIAAGPDMTDHYIAILIGAIGGGVSAAGIKLLQHFKIDDEVGAIPAHMGAGVWGTLSVCIAGGGNVFVQLAGIVSVGVFVFAVSSLVWRIMDRIVGTRVTRRVEESGQDTSELGIESFPEFHMVDERVDSRSLLRHRHHSNEAK